MHGLETVAHVGQGSGHNHAHRVSEIGLLHFLYDGNGSYVGRACAAAVVFIAGFCQWSTRIVRLDDAAPVRNNVGEQRCLKG